MTDHVTLKDAPLIEIVAELRWLPKSGSQLAPGLVLGTADSDPFLLNFARREEVVEKFTLAEKVVPPNFPSLWGHIVWRFKDPKQAGVLLQAGAGIFSANALQPYKSWSDFRPIVELGVKALLASRVGDEKAQPFSGVTLRYINGFTAKHMGKRSSSAFLREVLGFKLSPPKALADLGADDPKTQVNINLLIPVANKTKTMSVAVADGAVDEGSGSVAALVLDWSVSETASIEPTLDKVMSSLDASRAVIHDAFFELIEPIKDELKPETGR